MRDCDITILIIPPMSRFKIVSSIPKPYSYTSWVEIFIYPTWVISQHLFSLWRFFLFVFLLQTVLNNHRLSERKPNKSEACILLFLSYHLRLYAFYYIHIINLSNLYTFVVFYDIYINCKRRTETIF